MLGKRRVNGRHVPKHRVRHGAERGGAAIEYIAVLLVLASSLAISTTALSGSSSAQGALVKTVQYGICKGFEAGMRAIGVGGGDACGSLDPSKSKPLPLCTVYQQDRLLSGNVDFRFVHAEITGKDQILTLIDPATGKETAYVILAGERGIGVEGDTGEGGGKAAKFMKSKGVSVGGKATLQGGAGVVYKFDSEKDAQDFLNERRGNLLTRGLGAITGGATDGLFDGARHLFDKITGHDDNGPTPSGVVADLGLQAEGNVSFEGGSVPGTKGNGDFRAQVKATGKEKGQLRYNFDGTSQLSVRWEGEIGLQGGVGVNKDLQKTYPILQDLGANVGGELNGAVGYTIKFDKHGKPTQFILQTESGNSIKGQVGGKVYGKTGKAGDLTMHQYTLDLSDPQNMQAVQDTLPWVMAGQLASPAAPVGILASDNPLTQRLKDNSVEYEQHYDTSGDMAAAESPDSGTETGVKVKGFGAGYNNDTARRTLRSARYIDHTEPGSTWQNLAKCTKK